MDKKYKMWMMLKLKNHQNKSPISIIRLKFYCGCSFNGPI